MMLKGQSQIIQFLMFFMIGLAIFLIIAGAFRDKLDFFAEDITGKNREVINNYFSALSVQALVTCKQCDNVNISTRLTNTTAGAITQVGFNNTNLVTISKPGNKEYSSTTHGLLEDLTAATGVVLSSKPIVLSYTKNQNILRIVQ